MKDFRLALVAHRSIVGDKKKNLRTAEKWVRDACNEGANMICFPELNLTGHVGHKAMVLEAEPVPDGPSVKRLMILARELGVYVAAGICEDESGIHYNTQFVVGPDGYAGKQRKIHLSRDEYFYFRHGTSLPVLDLPLCRMGIVICYDNILPEVSRCLAVEGAEFLFCPHAARAGKWPRGKDKRAARVRERLAEWEKLHRARARDNGAYVGLCDMVGPCGKGLGVDANHMGGCMVVDPNGDIVAASEADDIKEEMIIADVSAEAVVARRNAPCFNLQTRRPEVFGALTRPTR